MIGTIVSIIILCIIAGFVLWAAQQLIALIPMGEPFVTIVRILMYALVLVIVIYALILLLGLAGVHVSTPKLSRIQRNHIMLLSLLP